MFGDSFIFKKKMVMKGEMKGGLKVEGKWQCRGTTSILLSYGK